MTERPGTKYQRRAAEVVGSYFGCGTTTAVRERSRLVNLIAKALADAEADLRAERDTLSMNMTDATDRIAQLETQLALWTTPEGHVWVKVHIDDVASLRAIQRIRDADGAPMYEPQALDRQEAHIRELEADAEILHAEIRKLTERILAQTAPPVLETDKQKSL